MISRNDYDPFGEIVSSTGLTQNAVTYTGQRLDSESGLMPLGNGERYYNPSYGRFIQQDSFAGFPQEPQSLNRFSYVINNPTKHTDPSGHIAPLVVLAVIGVGALIGGGVGAGYSYTKQQAEIADGTRKAADFSYTEIAKSAGLGALFGGAAAGIATVGTLAAAAVIGGGAVMSGVQLYQGYVDYQNGNEYSGKTDMAFGVAGVLLSFLGAKSLAGRSNTRVIQENVNKTTPKLQKQLGDGGVQQRISKGRLLNAAPEEIVNPPKRTRFIADENGGIKDISTGRGNLSTVGKKGSIKTQTTIDNIRVGVKETLSKYLDNIKELDANAIVGYRGSLARGVKGKHKGNAPFEPTKFDVDAFIISDKLASQIKPFRGARWGNKLKSLRGIHKSIHRRLKSLFPGLRDSKKDKFQFRIFTEKQRQNMDVVKDPITIIDGESN